MHTNNSIKRFAFTPGEPAGIGPDLAIIHAQQINNYELTAFADPQLIRARAQQLKLPIILKYVDLNAQPTALAAHELGIVPVSLGAPAMAGILNKSNAHYVLQCLDAAIASCQAQTSQAMITGPIQKSIINDAGITFSGHTEYLADKTQCDKVVMMLATQGLKVALATTHLPLKDVAAAINEQSLTAVIKILHHDLIYKFGIAHPKILVCGLNPHAGEGGHLGREEIDIIIPTLAKLARENIHCIGPLPADTLFTPKHLESADCVLAMYHDQGLPVLKFKGFGNAANITLGLPIIRTSVDHGTALDLAGMPFDESDDKQKIDAGSLSTAIAFAQQMANSSL
ncbi:MAG: 4-hydroxythreonine-4-phosphate dehydrogenase [Pseudohongiellaceae bacterium]|jgi:4-hydroxythreonine-4-phosphate dehydrogenase